MTELDDAPADLAPDPSVDDASSTEPTAQPQAAPSHDADAPDKTVASPPSGRPSSTIDLLSDVEIEVTVELGRKRLSIGEVTRLDVGSVIELDTLAGEPLTVYANGRQIATGEVVVVDGSFGVRIQTLSGRAAV